MTIITFTKTLPASYLYSGSGVTTISLTGANTLNVTSKSEPIKIQYPKTKNMQNATPTDLPKNMVIDLKKITQTMRISGYLDDDTETAWNKFWKLIAMDARGGPLTLLTIGTSAPIYFPSNSIPNWPTTTPQAFIVGVSGDIVSDDTGDISAIFPAKPARIKVDIDIYLGYER